VATSIVDKNGKFTTVHKAAVEPSAGHKSIPAPVTRKSRKTPPAGTPLPPEPMLTVQEIDEFLRREDMFHNTRGVAGEHGIASQESGLLSASFAKQLIDNDRLDPTILKRVLMRIPSEGDNYDTYNTLLIFDHLSNSPTALEGYSEYMLGVRVVEGLALHNSGGKAMPRINTEEELKGYAAVVRFASSPEMNNLRYTSSTNSAVSWRVLYETGGHSTQVFAVENRHLEKLLQEQPDDTELIIEYVSERGMHKRLKRPVDELRGWLEAARENPALHDGWL
jgi:hypothetical protein